MPSAGPYRGDGDFGAPRPLRGPEWSERPLEAQEPAQEPAEVKKRKKDSKRAGRDMDMKEIESLLERCQSLQKAAAFQSF